MPIRLFDLKEFLHAHSRAIKFLEAFKKEKFGSDNQALLKPYVLQKAIDKIAGIDGWVPMSALPRMPKQGYISWLGKWVRGNYPPSIAITSNLFFTKRLPNPKHAMYALLAVSLHEVGHEFGRDPNRPREFVMPGGAAVVETRADEVRAWFFAFCICGFIMASIAGSEVPDRVHEYLFQDV